MSKKQIDKKIVLEKNDESPLIENNRQNTGIRKRKILKKLNNLNKSYSKLGTGKENYQDDENEKNVTTQSNLEKIDYNKNIKQAKEIKDLEKIFKKWNNENEILMKRNISNISFRKQERNENINRKKPKYNVEEIRLKSKNRKELDFIKTNKIKKKKKISNSKEIDEEDEIEEIEEKMGIFDKITEIKEYKDKNKMQSQLEKIEKRMEKELEIINKKAYLFLDQNNNDLAEKLDYILEINNYIHKEILINKDDNLILPEEAALYQDDVILRFLGYIGSELSLNNNIETYIEKEPTNDILREVTFKILATDIPNQIIYKFILEDEKLKIIFEEDNDQWYSFLDKIKDRISKSYNISINDMYYFGNKVYKFEVCLLIYNKKINNIENILKNFHIKIIKNFFFDYIILSPSIFETKFCKNENDWPIENLKRGRKKYFPPYDWLGISLKVTDKFDKNDNTWLGKENKEGEWAVAYYGVGKGSKVLKNALNIMNNFLIEGKGKRFKNVLNAEDNNNEEYHLCGEGVYLSPTIEVAAKNADIIKLGNFDFEFQFVFMVRVNPTKIRGPGGFPVNWILNGNNDEIRPYRLLIKIS